MTHTGPTGQHPHARLMPPFPSSGTHLPRTDAVRITAFRLPVMNDPSPRGFWFTRLIARIAGRPLETPPPFVPLPPPVAYAPPTALPSLPARKPHVRLMSLVKPEGFTWARCRRGFFLQVLAWRYRTRVVARRVDHHRRRDVPEDCPALAGRTLQRHHFPHRGSLAVCPHHPPHDRHRGLPMDRHPRTRIHADQFPPCRRPEEGTAGRVSGSHDRFTGVR